MANGNRLHSIPALWTQTGSNRHLTPCRGVALPLVLWARGPRDRSRTCHARRRLGYGQVPSRDGVPRSDRGGNPRQGMARPRSAYWRSLQFSRSYFGATGQAHIEIQARHTSRGAGNRTSPMTVLETARLPAPHPSGLDSAVLSA